jgi:hypothetical protein
MATERWMRRAGMGRVGGIQRKGPFGMLADPIADAVAPSAPVAWLGVHEQISPHANEEANKSEP